jgi:hypothetical protein
MDPSCAPQRGRALCFLRVSFRRYNCASLGPQALFAFALGQFNQLLRSGVGAGIFVARARHLEQISVHLADDGILAILFGVDADGRARIRVAARYDGGLFFFYCLGDLYQRGHIAPGRQRRARRSIRFIGSQISERLFR